jgi:hypothetical protein
MGFYSERHAVAFVHVEKNAGSSIVHSLAKHLDVKHTKQFGFVGPLKGLGGLTVRDYEFHFGRRWLEAKFYFGLSRDPVNHLLSWYYYDPGNVSCFTEWLKLHVEHPFDQYLYFTWCDGSLSNARIFRFEEIESMWSSVQTELNFRGQLLHINKGINKELRKVSNEELYANMPLILERYEKDYKMFGYASPACVS